jgi:hypothetical protein
LIYFEVGTARAADLADLLSRALERDGGWYCD